jgi:hypothetical protein
MLIWVSGDTSGVPAAGEIVIRFAPAASAGAGPRQQARTATAATAIAVRTESIFSIESP